MKWIEYNYTCNETLGLTNRKRIEYNEVNVNIAKAEACNGEYTIVEDSTPSGITPLPVKFGGTGATDLEAFLSTETKTMYGLGAPAVPDDAFRFLKEHALPKIGDIKVTARTDLGDDWVLCNGEYFSENDYPEYASVCPDVESLLHLSKTKLFDSAGNGCQVFSVVEGDGYQAALMSAREPGSSSTHVLHVLYSTDWFETYVKYSLTATSNNSVVSSDLGPFFSYACLRYIDNKWLIVYTLNNLLYTLYTADIADHGSWQYGFEGFQVNYISNTYDVWKDEATGNVFVACCGKSSKQSSYYYPSIIKFASVEATTATMKIVANRTGVTAFGRNGSHCVFLCQRSTQGTLAVVYTDDVDGTWYTQEFSFDSATAHTVAAGSSLKYIDGKWCIFGHAIVDSYSSPIVCYTTDLSSNSWVCVHDTAAHVPVNNNSLALNLVYVQRARDVYIGIFTYSCNVQLSYVLVADNIFDANTWRYVNLLECVSEHWGADAPIHEILCDNVVNAGNHVFVSAYGGCFGKFPIYAFPCISDGACYAYVKVKE